MSTEQLTAWLAQQQQQALYRKRHVIHAQQQARIKRDQQWLINFSGNDYLGLSQHPEVKGAMVAGVQQWGVGSGASALVTGYRQPHTDLEEAMAKHMGFERALYVANGYVANLSVCTALFGPDDLLYMDRDDHASLIDGVRACGAKQHRYRRHRLGSLADHMASHQGTALLTDTVFSMTGAIAPLRDLTQLAKQHHLRVVADDAHGLGVLGAAGAGALSVAGLNASDVDVCVCPLGKAMGVYGAVILGSAAMIEVLCQRARALIYSTAPPPAMASAALAALQVMLQDDTVYTALQSNRDYFAQAIKAYNLPIKVQGACIYQWCVGSAEAAIQAQQSAQVLGLCCTAMRPPTVPMAEAGLRVVITATHSHADLDQLIDFLRKQHASYRT